MMIDTHIHLNDDSFKDCLDEIINNALAKGVVEMIVIGVNYQTSILAIEIANKYQGIYAAIGLHPSEVDKEKDLNLTWVENLAKAPKVVALGEIGLDFYWTDEFKDLQTNFFNKQIDIAKKLKLPLIIHSRNAIDLTYQYIKDKELKGVLHCYAGSYEMAQKFIASGFSLGIGGIITFKNAHLREVIKKIDLNYLLTETDAPYLAPVPFRGKMNKPEYIPLIVEEIAKIKNISVKEVASKTVENAHVIFNFEKGGKNEDN